MDLLENIFFKGGLKNFARLYEAKVNKKFQQKFLSTIQAS